LAVLCALILVLSSAADASELSGDPDAESAFVDEINRFRSDQGLRELEVDESLTLAARDWARSMAVAGQISHAPDLGVGVAPGWKKLGENVGVGPDVVALHEAFRASPTHLANLVDPAFNIVAVGVVRDGSTIFTTHRFMQRDEVDPEVLARVEVAETRAPSESEPLPEPAPEVIRAEPLPEPAPAPVPEPASEVEPEPEPGPELKPEQAPVSEPALEPAAEAGLVIDLRAALDAGLALDFDFDPGITAVPELGSLAQLTDRLEIASEPSEIREAPAVAVGFAISAALTLLSVSDPIDPLGTSS